MLAYELNCGLCRLRPWRATDRPMLQRYANNRQIWLNLRDGFPHPYGPSEADGWLGYAAADPPPEGLWAIDLQGEAILRRSAVKDGRLVDQVLYAPTRDPGLPYVSAGT